MSAAAVTSTWPAPPPFYKLYTFPPPPPPPSSAGDATVSAATPAPSEEEAAAHAAAAALLPLDIYQPPPPIEGTYTKFGEVHTSGFLVHPLDVPQLFKSNAAPTADGASTDAAASAFSSSSAGAAATSSVSSIAGLPTPPVLNYTATLRSLNRQYMQAFIALLGALTSPPPPATANDSSAATSGSPSPAAPSTDGGPDPHVQRALVRVSEVGSNYAWLLSQLRPHQALQTLLHMQMRQLEKRKKKVHDVRSCIHDAKSFLAAHGVHYAEGSTSIVPDTSMDPAAMLAVAAGAAPAGAAAAAGAQPAHPVVKQEHAAGAGTGDAMDTDDGSAETAQVKRENGTHDATVPSALSQPQTPLDLVAQLRAFLDAIPDQ